MAYGGMVGYLMIIKSDLSFLVRVNKDDMMMRNVVLTLSSLMVLLPILLQRVRFFISSFQFYFMIREKHKIHVIFVPPLTLLLLS